MGHIGKRVRNGKVIYRVRYGGDAVDRCRCNPKEVTVRAGHTSVAFTLDRYGHLFEGHDAELRDRLDAMHVEGLRSGADGALLKLRTGSSRAGGGPHAGPSKPINQQGPPW